jgi:flavin-dependent dehydrogenase
MGKDVQTDVVVIGGGPAGSTVSTLVAQQGPKVTLFERETFPRFHIGESLIPETYWVLQRLNMLPKLKASPFTQKHSVQFVNSQGRESAPFYFWDNKPHECSQTWQVVRSQFDQMMLDNAREHGVDVHEGVRVHEVLFEDGRAVGVTIRDPDGSFRDVRAKVVVDASGQNGLLMNRLNLRVWDPILNKGAIWTYWKGAYRDTGKDAGATLVIQNGNRQGWFWYIPLHDDVRPTKKRSGRRQACASVWRTPRVRRGSSRPRTTRTDRSRLPATAGCSSATRSGSSTRSTPQACCWR